MASWNHDYPFEVLGLGFEVLGLDAKTTEIDIFCRSLVVRVQSPVLKLLSLVFKLRSLTTTRQGGWGLKKVWADDWASQFLTKNVVDSTEHREW